MQKAKQTASFYTVFNYRYCIKYMRRDKNSAISVTCETIRDVISFSYLHSITEDQNPGVLLNVDPYSDPGYFPDHEAKKPHFHNMKFFIRNIKGTWH
jgi:hypothetical protein